MNYGELSDIAYREIDDETGRNNNQGRIEEWQMLVYANEAEAEACIRARLLVDSSTPDICSIPVSSGTAVYAYDPSIVLILRGRMTGATKPLGGVSHTVMDELSPGWEDHEGDVEAFVTGMHTGMVMLYRKPSAAGTLNLTVVRTPLNPMGKRADMPEINSRLHPALVLWMKHKIYNNQDSELFDKNRADVHLAAFEEKFGRRTAEPYGVFDSMQITYAADNYNQDGYY